MSAPLRSRLLTGTVRHRRARHTDYDFTHRVWYLALDLDELGEVDRRLRWFSVNRRNLLSLRDRDHLQGDGPLVEGVRARLEQEGVDPASVRVTLIAYPRVFGYGFNPVSFYLCHRRSDGTLRLVLAEVHNTHGDRQVYAFHPLPGTPARGHQTLRGVQPKQMYVSPFIALDATYELRAWEGPDRLAISIHESEGAERTLFASLDLQVRPLTERRVLGALARDPLVTFKTSALILWHALRLWRRGVPGQRYRRPSSRAGEGPIA